jgi:hypothetical protein
VLYARIKGEFRVGEAIEVGRAQTVRHRGVSQICLVSGNAQGHANRIGLPPRSRVLL